MHTGSICRLLIALLAAGIGMAQTSTSSINGTVADPTGAVVPGATVKVVNENTGVAYTQTTTEAGVYVFPALPVGQYSVMVEMRGFRTTQRRRNVLEVGTPLTVDVSLEIGDT